MGLAKLARARSADTCSEFCWACKMLAAAARMPRRMGVERFLMAFLILDWAVGLAFFGRGA